MGKKGDGDGVSAVAVPVDADALKADVRAFAAQLGLSAAAGDGDSGAFDDFRPEKARQKIGKVAPTQPPAGRAAAAPSEDSKGADKAVSKQKRAREGQHQGESNNAVPVGSNSAPAPAKAVPARDWNFGAGPRPGSATGKSLLGKEDTAVWYEVAAALPQFPAPTEPVDPDLFERQRQRCEQLMEAESSYFERSLSKRNSTDAHWLQQVKRAGTTTDRVAAMTLLVQESVIANMKSLDTLTGWVAKRSGGREVVRQAIEALQELFLNVLLPNRKLKFLEQQPLQAVPAGKEGERILLYWFVEDCLKRRYALFVEALEAASKDQLDFIKEKATKAISCLLSSKPEGEAKLLSALVNKLGDPDRKLASKAGYLLAQLLLTHPGMKPVVVREVERFVFRPGQAERARYYCIIFLNQLALSHKESEGGGALAKKLIDVYFTLFKMLVEGSIGKAAEVKQQQEAKWASEKKKYFKKREKALAAGKKAVTMKPPKKPLAEEMDARMMSGLIAGVRRAFPYVPSDEVEPLIDKHAGHLFRMVHTAPFSVAVQALMLMYQLMSARNAVSDRFYRALYAVLLSEGPTTSSKAPMFLALLFRAMKADVSVKRVAAFAKRLLQVCAEAPPNVAAGGLFLLSEVLQAQPALWSAVTQPEDVGGLEETFKDMAAPADSDDDVEAFKDTDDAADDDAAEQEQLAARIDVTSKAPGTADGPSTSGKTAMAAGGLPGVMTSKWPQEGYYDMEKREPLFCGGDRSCWWELTALASHVHPSVAAMARTLMSGAPIVYDGDPLRDHNLTAFLDKFLLKKPKAHAKGSSLMQPLVAAAPAKSAAAVGSEAFAAIAEGNVAPADLFFHKFYNLQSVKAKRASAQQTKKKKAEDDDDDTDAADGAEVGSDDDVDAFLDGEEDTGGDDKLGDPDVGYSYEELAEAMAAGEDIGGDEGEEGTLEDEEMGDLDDAVSEEGSGGSDAGTVSGGEDGESSEDEDLVRVSANGRKQRGPPASEEDDSLDGVNVNELPSPTSSEEADEWAAPAPKRQKAAAAKAAVPKKQAVQLKLSSSKSPAEEVEDDGEEELGSEDLDRLMTGAGDSDSDDDMGLDDGADSDDLSEEAFEEEQPSRKKARKAPQPESGAAVKAKGKGRGGLPDFAAAEEYEDLFKQFDQSQAAAKAKAGAMKAAAGGSGGDAGSESEEVEVQLDEETDNAGVHRSQGGRGRGGLGGGGERGHGVFSSAGGGASGRGRGRGRGRSRDFGSGGRGRGTGGGRGSGARLPGRGGGGRGRGRGGR